MFARLATILLFVASVGATQADAREIASVGPLPVAAAADPLLLAEVELFRDIIEKMRKQPEPPSTRPVNCKPIRGRAQNSEQCRMA
jgi:hypothetical protein